MARGRPTVDNHAVLLQIKNNPEKLKQYETYVDTIQTYIGRIQDGQDGLKDTLSCAYEDLGLTKAFLKKTATSRIKGNAGDVLKEAEALVEAVDLRSDDLSEEEF